MIRKFSEPIYFMLFASYIKNPCKILCTSYARVENFNTYTCHRNPRRSDIIRPPGAIRIKKYEIMTESNASIIEHTDEEKPLDTNVILSGDYDDLNLKRGVTGVFDIEDLISVIKRENVKDIFVATVPKKIHYVDYICVVSGRSKRHLLAIAEFVRKVYKLKCNDTDLIPKIEGRNSDEWLALDLGNIAFHIFSDKARKQYDLESLWAVGAEYDDQANKKDEGILEIFQSYSDYLKDLKPN